MQTGIEEPSVGGRTTVEPDEVSRAIRNLEENAGLAAIERRTLAFQSLLPGHVCEVPAVMLGRSRFQ